MRFTTKAFWADLAERTISTGAQAAIALLTGSGLGLLTVDWITVVSVSGLAALVAALKAFAVAKTLETIATT